MLPIPLRMPCSDPLQRWKAAVRNVSVPIVIAPAIARRMMMTAAT
jgi:hypothetical protein